MNINQVTVTGNLCRDPELRAIEGGGPVCKLRVAVNERAKQDGEWADRANYFDVAVFGSQAESCSEYLSKGRGVAIAGRLRWHEWEAKDGQKRQGVEIVASQVQFLGSGGGRPGDGAGTDPGAPATAAVGGEIAEDDLPF